MEAVERMIRSTIFSGLLTVHRALDREARGVGDVDLVDYLILSRAVLTPGGAPMRRMPDELRLPVDMVAARCAQFERSRCARRIRDQSDRRAFSLSPTRQGRMLHDLISASLNLRLRTLWASLPESTFDGILQTVADLAAVPETPANAWKHQPSRTAYAVHCFAGSCLETAVGLDLTTAGSAILLLLDDAAGHRADFADIPASLGMPQTVALPTLELLEASDLITHEDIGPDRNSVSLTLAPRGGLLCADLRARLVAALLERNAQITEESFAALASICSLLCSNTRRTG